MHVGNKTSHGASYTTFSFSGLHISTSNSAFHNATVSLTVTNTGKVPGTEVVQMYLGQNRSSAGRPAYGMKQLQGFRRVSLKPGESAQVSMPISTRAVSVWDVTAAPSTSAGAAPEGGAWAVAEGTFDVSVGPSSCDARLRGTLAVAAAVTAAAP